MAQDIGARILRGEYAPGSLLPNEAEWCDVYGVSRTAVREAIKMLAAKGLIVSRPKIGSRVRPREVWNLLDRDVLAWYWAASDQHHFLSNVQQMREMLEPEVTALAALNHTDSQLAAIESAYMGMVDSTNTADWNTNDVKFHLAVLGAAGNELLVPLGFLIESALSNMFEYTASHNEELRAALPLHEAILTAIRRRSPVAARRAARALLADTSDVIGKGRKPNNAAKAKSNARKRSA
ncbi:MAG TPA: FadR/GntR family transcriptional regulator [Dongiaceae bacterium]|nr:FadR/GntR family transcriptional regulator [Dongiaceae bacterium]